MQDWLIAPLAGAALIATGIVFMLSHVRSWKQQQNDFSPDESARRHYRSRYRRRIQASGLIILIGLLIPLGDWIPWKQSPLLFSIYWGIVLLLTLWIAALGLGDLLSIGIHSRVELSRIRQKQRELEEQIEDIKKHSSNDSRVSE